jgi:hypothetical protein
VECVWMKDVGFELKWVACKHRGHNLWWIHVTLVTTKTISTM